MRQGHAVACPLCSKDKCNAREADMPWHVPTFSHKQLQGCMRNCAYTLAVAYMITTGGRN